MPSSLLSSLSKTLYFPDGKIKSHIKFDENKKLHSDDGPAVVYYNNNGEVTREEFWKEGILLLVNVYKFGRLFTDELYNSNVKIYTSNVIKPEPEATKRTKSYYDENGTHKCTEFWEDEKLKFTIKYDDDDQNVV